MLSRERWVFHSDEVWPVVVNDCPEPSQEHREITRNTSRAPVNQSLWSFKDSKREAVEGDLNGKNSVHTLAHALSLLYSGT